MKITKDEVLHVAKLARLKLTREAVGKFSGQIADILEYVNTLNSVDTEGIVPTSHAIFLSNAFREDEIKESMGADKALANAPEKEDGNFIVPKVISS